jgi:uncharacterized RDD family membrane protein YckC
MSDAPVSYVAYASFGARLRALVVDTAVVAALLIILVVAGEVARDISASGRVFVALLLAVALLYEPVQVWRYGGTIGHRMANLRVVADATGGNPGFARAFARFLIKTILGVFSFVAMALTRRHQAVHDSLSRTTVQIRDFHRARATDFAFERTVDPSVQLPSRSRRVVVVLLFLAGVFVAMSLLMIVLVSPDCLDDVACTSGETLVANGLSLTWLAVSVFLIIAGWRGRLWGARATKGESSSGQPIPQ